MELRGHRRAKKPQSGFFSRHYSNGRVASKRLIARSASGFQETARRISRTPRVRGAHGISRWFSNKSRLCLLLLENRIKGKDSV